MGNCVTKLFGRLSDGKEVYSYTLNNNTGMAVTVINYGATITSLKVPAANGTSTDVALGFQQLNEYTASFNLSAAPYLGAVVGRYAGRMANASFRLDGKVHNLNKNFGKHTLHGGVSGFSRAFWKLKSIAGGKEPSLTLNYISKDGEEGFPGKVEVAVIYTLKENNTLQVAYTATTTKDTVINLTQHTYFNLNGEQGTVTGQEVCVNADNCLEVTAEGIPTGNFIKVPDMPLVIDERGAPEAMDTSFIVKDDDKPVAWLKSVQTGIKMSVDTNQPSVHVYIGGKSGDIPGKSGVAYTNRSGICFEAQNFPDAPNKPDFPDAALKAGETYRQTTSFCFETIKSKSNVQASI